MAKAQEHHHRSGAALARGMGPVHGTAPANGTEMARRQRQETGLEGNSQPGGKEGTRDMGRGCRHAPQLEHADEHEPARPWPGIPDFAQRRERGDFRPIDRSKERSPEIRSRRMAKCRKGQTDVLPVNKPKSCHREMAGSGWWKRPSWAPWIKGRWRLT